MDPREEIFDDDDDASGRWSLTAAAGEDSRERNLFDWFDVRGRLVEDDGAAAVCPGMPIPPRSL